MSNGVTIGIPVYNEELRIERAIRSAIGQCQKLIVSDNASTDGTGRICEALAREFDTLEYIRHPRNLGALDNWNFTLNRANTDFLMLLGAHDHIEPGYIDTLLPALKADPGTAGVFGQLYYEYDDRIVEDRCFNSWHGGTLETPKARVKAMFYSRTPIVWATYGLYRTPDLKRFFTRDLHPYGVDVLFIARILVAGKLELVKGARYNAWMRDNDKFPSDYLERIFGNKQKASKQRLRNEFRIVQHEFILEVCAPQTLLQRIAYRLQSATHFCVFKLPGIDPLFYLTYLPAKIVRRLIRARLKLDKNAC